MKRKVREIVADVLGLDVVDITDDISRETTEGWDSLAHLRLITAIEQEFGVTLTMDEINGAVSMQHLVALLESRDLTAWTA